MGSFVKGRMALSAECDSPGIEPKEPREFRRHVDCAALQFVGELISAMLSLPVSGRRN
jgi:hypothetical protein